MNEEVTYQKILDALAKVPVKRLSRVYDLIRYESVENDKNKESILQFAGSWNEFSDSELEDFLGKIQENRKEIFERNIEL
ncbi:MAG: hypothetical protein JXL97_04960 [Bacteroidales bacterium]|nr:hypothetical protein [Bacteroidales bacterium]